MRNRAHPEGSMAEEYIADECMTFCSRFIDGPTRFTRPERNPNPSDEIQDSYMFESAGEPVGKIDSVYQFNDHSLVQAHRYVLRHCDELADLRRCARIINYSLRSLLIDAHLVQLCTEVVVCVRQLI